MPDDVLRLNHLRRRARVLATDVEHVIAHDAAQQREFPPAADDEEREEIFPAVRAESA
jgi:hypothetical protein